MAKLTSKKRAKIPSNKFGLPKERKYPVDTKERAANAKARAEQMEKKGKLSSSKKSKIDAKANKVLKKHKKRDLVQVNSKSKQIIAISLEYIL